MNLSNKLELLSPARNCDIGIAAVDHGADAIYIGGPDFGARAQAANSVYEISRLCDYAHKYNARIFATLNTILHDNELENARKLIWQLYDAGVDALIIQDMGLLELDLPPIQLHASTQTDIRTPEKAKFLQDVGFSQIVLARELDLKQIAKISEVIDPAKCKLEFFIHGALCVAYSGQCYISHAHTGRSANRGDCSQACRLPYQVQDSKGRFIAHDAHVLSMKDNNQSENLLPLIKAGLSSFKIEGRYKDMAYVKNITAHYRKLLDDILNDNPEYSRISDGTCTFGFTPEPLQNFNREFTDYFVNGRKNDIGAFDTPKNSGQAIGYVVKVDKNNVKQSFDIKLDNEDDELSNGDGFCYYNLQKELIGAQSNRVENLKNGIWRIYPKDNINTLIDLRAGTVINRNRSMNWVRSLEKKSAERKINTWFILSEKDSGLNLNITDENGNTADIYTPLEYNMPKNNNSDEIVKNNLSKLGETIFSAINISINTQRKWFIPISVVNKMRQMAVVELENVRANSWKRLPRAKPLNPPAIYPDDALTYLANVSNNAAHNFYKKHGVKIIDAAYENHQELGDVSLMITKHCVRYSLSLCPKQAKGVTGVQGTVRAEPLVLINGKEKLQLKFDCKPCEMHVIGKIKKSVLNQFKQIPIMAA